MPKLTAKRRPIGIDLFSGVGGMSLGFEQAGFDIVASVEYDPVHAAVHKFNFPATEVICADIALLKPADLIAAAQRGYFIHHDHPAPANLEIDAIVGGPPCQGFSTIGKRLLEDDRNDLVFHFLRIIAGIRPRYFVMENVPGMAAGGHSSILLKLVHEFEGAGYCLAKPRILNAADYGVPQNRRRLILIGMRADQLPAEYPAPTVVANLTRNSKMNGQPTLRSHALPHGPTVWDAIGDLPNLDDFEELQSHDEVLLSRAIVSKMERFASPYVRHLRGLIEDPDDLSHPRAWDPRMLTSSMRTIHTIDSIKRFDATNSGETEPISRFFKLEKGGLCNTLRSGTGSERGAFTSPRPIHPIHPRVLSVREAARLHSYPDWFRFHRTKWHGFRQIGNSVPPLLARAIAAEIVKVLRVSPTRPTRSLPLDRSEMLSMDRLQAARFFGANLSAIPKSRLRELSTA